MTVVELKHKCQILAGSTYGMNSQLQDEEVDEGW